MENSRIPTGEVLPRDYGITYYVATGRRSWKVFTSPMRHAIAQLMLESPKRIRARIQERSERTGVPAHELERAFVEGVVHRSGTKNILNYHGCSAVRSVNLYRGEYRGSVKSKGGEGAAYVTTDLIPVKGARGPFKVVPGRCSPCKDAVWNQVKLRAVECWHGAALAQAIHKDERRRASVRESLTGLLPRNRLAFSLPFNLSVQGDLDRIVTDALFSYFVEGRTYFDINRELLQHQGIYSGALREGIERGRLRWTDPRFAVLRHAERTVDASKASAANERLYAASRSVKEQVVEELVQHGFSWQGYSLHLQDGAPVIARRFAQGIAIREVCVGRDEPPLIVEKQLGELAPNWEGATGNRLGSPFRHVGRPYDTIDDATRRIARARIALPGSEPASRVHVPEDLKALYRRLARA